jgi:protein-disulfide isomerase
MASGKKKQRGPKPAPKSGAKSGGGSRPAPSANPRPSRGAAAAATRRGLSWQWWVVIVVVIGAGVIGIVVQSSRSDTENAKVVTPKHALGPNGSELTGDPSAPVLVQEYADFQCPTCKAFHDEVGATLTKLINAKTVRFAYTYFPFLGEESVQAAAAAACAGDQGKFFPYYNQLYANQHDENSGYLTTDRLVSLGKDAGITGTGFTAFEKCVRSGRYVGWARKQADAASKRGITGTPTVFVNGKEISTQQALTPSIFKSIVNEAAKQKQ